MLDSDLQSHTAVQSYRFEDKMHLPVIEIDELGHRGEGQGDDDD